MNYIASETYDKESISKMAKRKSIEGVVLGDGYCQKRMFPHGEPELVECALNAHNHALRVVLQTPCYMTDRVYEKYKQLIQYLFTREICKDVLVQDVGLATDIKKSIPEINLIWSQLSHSRNGAENLLFYRFIKKIGISGVELVRPELAGYLKEMGLAPVYTNKKIQYSTVNRECYFIHELGLWDHTCERGCLQGNARLVNEKRRIDMSINGFMLNRSYTDVDLSDVSTDNEMIILRGRELDDITS